MNSESLAKDVKLLKLIEGKIVMGMTTRQAAFYAGVDPGYASQLLGTPEAKKEMEELRDMQRKRLHITKERVVSGMVDAIEQAKMIGDPKSQINGWKELGKMEGLYAPTEHKVHVSKDATKLQRQLEAMPRDELLRLANADVIDADFVEVKADD